MLTVKGLNAGYGKLVVLHDLSLTLPEQQFTAILGANGSGKSTLLKSIFGLTDIVSGSIQFIGQELAGQATENIGQFGIAYVPQRNNIFTALTVQENLALIRSPLKRKEADAAMQQAYELFPILAKRQNQRAGSMSGGERQMLAIAMGWLLRPRMMLLDEPTAGLAPVVATEVFRTLKQLNESGITIAVVEQNARSVLRWCDTVFILREGQVVFQDTAAACLADEETVKTYLGTGGKFQQKA